MIEKLEELKSQLNKIYNTLKNGVVDLKNMKFKLLSIQIQILMFQSQLYDKKIDDILNQDMIEGIINIKDGVDIRLNIGVMGCNLQDIMFDARLDYYKDKTR